MEPFLNEFIANKIFLAAAISWLVAQSIKVLLTFLVEKEIRIERMHGSGGMPSAHTATIVSASTAIGIVEGWSSSIYALSLIMAFIVMYDASGVRRSVGKQAKWLNDIIFDFYKHKHVEEEKLKELIGHKPTEVVVGAILGIIIANLVV
ncbi:MAG TPA: divergent PAP2 family protein [Fusibacter sp.]|nr:divergent PAP2 family protein [Fusibacter sp.]